MYVDEGATFEMFTDKRVMTDGRGTIECIRSPVAATTTRSRRISPDVDVGRIVALHGPRVAGMADLRAFIGQPSSTQ
jgi:hypothetical protein